MAALSKLYSRTLQHSINPQTDVLVTIGAYLALYYSFLGWLNKGDEVIVLEPAYDSYLPQIKMGGGIPVPVVLELAANPKTSADYKLDLEKIESKITKKTKMLVLNNPNVFIPLLNLTFNLNFLEPNRQIIYSSGT